MASLAALCRCECSVEGREAPGLAKRSDTGHTHRRLSQGTEIEIRSIILILAVTCSTRYSSFIFQALLVSLATLSSYFEEHLVTQSHVTSPVYCLGR